MQAVELEDDIMEHTACPKQMVDGLRCPLKKRETQDAKPFLHDTEEALDALADTLEAFTPSRCEWSMIGPNTSTQLGPHPCF